MPSNSYIKDDCPTCDGKKTTCSKVCVTCYRKTRCKNDRKVWDKEKVIFSIKKFYEINGKTPAAHLWEYKYDPCYPTTKTVLNVFGKWNKAIEAAGYPTRKPKNPRL